MEKPFRPLALDALARWIFTDLAGSSTVLGIPRANIETPDPRLSSVRLGRPLAAPLGVAAGPHTQLAQNIVAAWLCGARFIELKTVQILDEIKVSRPCIDAQDATYNCEWSQELKLDQSFDEYLKAWVLVHGLARRMGLASPGVHFNMSVGYDLKGIQSAPVQRFLQRMRDASAELPAAIDAVAKSCPEVRDIDISPKMSHHVTLSTMHGCPPSEIERIARYMLTELGVHTWVKLNPTLLGPEALREILNKRMGHDIEVPDAAFEHDPRFPDAMQMVRNLAAAARGREQSFGIKLSNTLEVVNRRSVFPPNEKMMYMSGRALHPVTLTLAHQVTEALDNQVPISFCGGADAFSFPELIADGLGPVTVCTDLLKPGGYGRLQQYLFNLELAMERVGADSLDAYAEAVAGGRGDGARGNLARHARRVLDDRAYAQHERPIETKGPRHLGHFDCVAAPCQEGCPARQNIPDYLWLVSHGRIEEAAQVILHSNPLPCITGSVCDHPCAERCVRNHIDRPLAIREIKRFAIETAAAKGPAAGAANGVRVAIIGGGPAGLSAAWFLAQAGFSVTVFDAKKRLGGMASGVIPSYRLSEGAIESDLERIRALGVEFKLGVRIGKDLSLAKLREQGFAHVVLAVGAQTGKRLGIPGEDAAGVLDALDFLDRVRAGQPPQLGRRVLVVGGGNSAMDAARTARRLVGAEGSVDLVYRRTRAQMPAEPEEVLACLEEGVGLRDLLAPLRVQVEKKRATALVCGRMKLGAPDASGRPRPVPVEGAEEALPCDTVISAISQEPLLDFLGGLKLATRRDGTLEVDAETLETSEKELFAAGDVVRGPATVVKAVADGHAVANAIARRHGIAPAAEPTLDKHTAADRLLARKALKTRPQTVPTIPVEQRSGFAPVIGRFSPEEAAAEASRCLDCDELCSLCVTVCPNRANQAYETSPLRLELPTLIHRKGRLEREPSAPFVVAQQVQTLNIGDFCNACGNCATFCPTSGAPYKDKPQFWLEREGFEAAAGDAFHLSRRDAERVLEARIGGRRHSLTVRDGRANYTDGKVAVQLEVQGWKVIEAQALGKLAEGERVELAACATMIALLAAEPSLPAVA